MGQEHIDFLRRTDIFAVLDPAELADLAGGLEINRLSPDQIAIKQGDRGSSLFIVKSGELAVAITDNSEAVHVGNLGEGEFFGEMSLLTGTPRTATVRSITETTVLEVTKAILAPLLQRHGELASLMSRILSERQSSNLKTLMELERPSVNVEKETLAAQLTWRIGSFFQLPASIWGKTVDGIAGFSIGGPLGFILGKTDDTPSARPAAHDDRQIAFTTAIITLAAKMVAAGGSYSQREVAQLREIFDIPASDMANVTRIYNRAQGSPKGFEPYAQQIAKIFADQKAVLEELIGTLLKVSQSSGSGRMAMEQFIEQIAVLFGLSAQEVERLKVLDRRGKTPMASDTAEDYLTVLSISEGATLAEAKRAYHKLVREHHPDKLISEGMPEEFIRQANEKLALINTAYEQFRTEHQAA